MGILVAFDIETNGKPLEDPDLEITMLAIDDGNTVKVFLPPNIAAGVDILSKAPGIVGHNSSSFDRRAIRKVFGVNLKCDDTMLMEYILNEEKHSRKLESLAVTNLGVKPWKRPIEEMTLDEEAEYCAKDTRYTRRLYEKFKSEMSPGQYRVYRDLLLPASRALCEVEDNGVYISCEKLDSAKREISQRVDEARGRLVQEALRVGLSDFNPASPRMVGRFLFDKLGLDPIHHTSTGQPATDEETLKLLRGEEVKLLLEYRRAAKLLSTYVLPYGDHRRADGRIHPSYSLTQTVTGRTSSYGPNIQQLPRLPIIRNIVSAPSNHVLVQADLSMIELRLGAWLAREENMLTALRRGDDIHMLMAKAITGKENPSSEDRSRAKVANFAFLYGAEAHTFKTQALKEFDLDITIQEAVEYRNAFHRMWPGFTEWYERVWKDLESKGYIESPIGRIRHLSNVRSLRSDVRVEALRQAVNFPVQSLASDLALTGLTTLVGIGFKVVAFVHDAVLIEEPGLTPDDRCAIIKRVMEADAPAILEAKFGVRLDVPIVCEVKYATYWS